MNNTMFVKPAEGLQVRDPRDSRGVPLPDEGKDVPRNSYWLRRLRDGDVVETKPVKPAKNKSTNRSNK